MDSERLEVIKSASHIKALRTEHGLTQEELSDILDINRTTIGKYESGAIVPSGAYAKRLSQFFNVSTDYILGLTDEKRFDVSKLSNYAGRAESFIRVPVIGTVKCGPGGLAYQYLDGTETIPVGEKHSDIVAFRCSGDSMSGLGIFAGDIAFVHLQPVVDSGELAVVVVDGEEGMLKRVIRRGDALILESANPAYSSRVFIGDETNLVKIVGKVLWVKKTF